MATKRGPYVRSAATRSRLLETLAKRPDATRAELARATGLPWAVVAAHLRTLEEQGAITGRPVGRMRCYRVVEPRAMERD